MTKLIEVRGADESEIFDNISGPEKKAFMKEMAQQSIYMNPELLTKFFNLLI